MNEEQNIKEKEKPKDTVIAQIIHRYLPFWPIFIVLVTISLTISLLYLRSQTKIYIATAKVLLKDPQKGSDTKVLDALNIFSEKKIVENEIIVLKSSSLIQEVVKDLNLYATVYNEGKVQREELYRTNSPISFIAVNKNNINASGKFYFKINWGNESVSIANQTVRFGNIVNIGNCSYRIIINNDYNKTVTGKNFYAVFNSVSAAAASISRSIKAAPLSYASTVIDLKLETPVPEKGIDILNKLFVIYNKFGIDDKNQMATKTLRFIEDRLNSVIGQLDSVEHNIETYKSKNDVVDLGSQAMFYFNNIKDLDKINSTIELQLQLIDDVLKYVNSKGKKNGTVPSLILINDETLRSLLSQLYTAEFDFDKTKSNAGDKSEIVILAEEKINRIKDDLRENIRNIRSNFTLQKQANDRNVLMNKGLYSLVPQKERGLLEISRQQAIKSNIYNYLLQKREETALSSASTSADLRILENGSSYGPISPIPKTYYFAGILIGFIIFLLFWCILKLISV